ncbi:MAG: phosphatidylserine decarboxylase family protein [Desulforhopalus sp.]
MLTPQVPVSKEGYPFIAFAAFITLILAILGMAMATLVTFFLTLFILSFFRDPERLGPEREDAIVSPADGKVIRIEDLLDNTFTGKEAKKVSIFMNVFNVHVNRSPVDGSVDKVQYKAGKFYSADSVKGGLENEYCATLITTPQGKSVAVVQIAGLIARRIVCWLEPGDQLIRGRRFGLIRFGSRVDLYLPPETDVTITVGERVRAGESVLGFLN